MSTDPRYRCAMCGQLRPEENFYRMLSKPTSARPVMYWCIPCCRAYKRSEQNRAADQQRKQRRRVLGSLGF